MSVRLLLPPHINIDCKLFGLECKGTGDRGMWRKTHDYPGDANCPENGSRGLQGNPSVETRKKLEQLLEAVTHSGEIFRVLRAMEVLEQIGTPETRQVLKTLAANAPGSRLREEAQAVLDRLDRAKRL